MLNLDDVIQEVHNALNRFDELLTHPTLREFPTLSAQLTALRDEVRRVDVRHLGSLPRGIIRDLADLISQSARPISEFTANSYPPEAQATSTLGLPQGLARNATNVEKWEKHLHTIRKDLFLVVAPIIAHQSQRLNRLATSTPVYIDTDNSKTNETANDVIWRYMPLSNLIRCETAGGLWLASLERLAVWSDQGISDTREGEIPPLLHKLNAENTAAKEGTPADVEQFKQRYGFSDPEWHRLQSILWLAFNPGNIFVSSWARRLTETPNMWMHYGSRGTGVAFKSRVSKLVGQPWKIPWELSGLTVNGRFQRLLIRPVKYLRFDEHDVMPAVDDLYGPFLKRLEFEDEHEIRIIGFTTKLVEAAGLTLLCDLQQLIDEIVVGPHANFEETKSAIERYAADLRDVPITKSKLSSK